MWLYNKIKKKHMSDQMCSCSDLQNVKINYETSRFKREQMREIVHASCLNVKGNSKHVCRSRPII